MDQYLDIAARILEEGNEKVVRGHPTLSIPGAVMEFDLQDGFPLLTTKQVFWKMAIGEQLGFIRGYDNAADFRALGCKVWDDNANNPGTEDAPNAWFHNPNRKGFDDLGRIYGVQARRWRKPIRAADRTDALLAHDKPEKYEVYNGVLYRLIDQLGDAVAALKKGQDNRRLIVSHWNPSDMDNMALPPCHIQYQFGLSGPNLDTVNLMMTQRSCDFFLGVPFNIVHYALMLEMVARITGKKAGKFMHVMWDVHFYTGGENDQRAAIIEQLENPVLDRPVLLIAHRDQTDLEDFEVNDFTMLNYEHAGPIRVKMAV